MKIQPTASLLFFVAGAVAIFILAIALRSSPSKGKALRASSAVASSQVPALRNMPGGNGGIPAEGRFPAEVRSEKVRLANFHRIDFNSIVRGIHGVVLNEEQLDKMLQVYAAVYDERQKYEASIATVSDLENGDRVISIPSYRARGEEMMARLTSAFEGILGPKTSHEFIQQAGGLIRGRNEEFGKYPQVFVVSIKAGDGYYLILHSLNPDMGDGFRAEGYTRTLAGSLETSQWGAFSHLFPRAR